MIIEINTKILDIPDININQLVFLSVVLNKNQKNNQDVRKIVSLISDDEIQQLIDKDLITSIERGNSITYTETDKLTKVITLEKDYFDLFYDMYPIYVLRPDGIKNYLRANVNKCRHLFKTISGNSEAMSEHLIDCLKFELEKKTREGKLSYMKTMWRWLVDHQWEATEEETHDTAINKVDSYGTDIV